MAADDILLDVDDRMDKAIQHLKQQLSGIRTGRANPGLVDTLKVDQSFVSAMRGDVSGVKMVEAILQLAKLFDLKVVAEGIEQADEESLLKERACDFGQGWHYGKPLPAEICLQMVRDQQDEKKRAVQ